MTHVAQPWAGSRAQLCARCDTELAPPALACPACGTLVHGAALRDLAARAEALEAGEAPDAARERWGEALALLPEGSRQHAVVAGRIAALDARLSPPTEAGTSNAGTTDAGAPDASRSWWRSGGALAVTLVLLLAGKLKFILLGLTKLKTFVSMFAFFGVYWTTFGWPLALGLVLSIYVHEMGHVAALRRLRIDAGAPLFIPGLGAFVLLKQRIEDPRHDALVGLAGPVWGLAAALAAYAAWLATGAPIWLAIAQLGGFVNLFNLIPVWQLDGARGFHALATAERWLVVAAVGVAYLASGVKLLLLVGPVAAWYAWRRPSGPGDRRALATFVGLVGVLAWLSAQRAV